MLIDRRVALFRGISVGKAKRIAMADLRNVFQSLGHTDTRTLLNSGNVVFTAGKTSGDPGSCIERAVADRLGVSSRVTILTGKEVAQAIRRNPLASLANDPSRLLIMAFDDSKAAAFLKPMLRQTWSPEALALWGRFAYLWCPGGVAKSPLWKAANRAIGDGGTARNLNTMLKLAALVEAPSKN